MDHPPYFMSRKRYSATFRMLLKSRSYRVYNSTSYFYRHRLRKGKTRYAAFELAHHEHVAYAIISDLCT